jgi:hypothetical protein
LTTKIVPTVGSVKLEDSAGEVVFGEVGPFGEQAPHGFTQERQAVDSFVDLAELTAGVVSCCDDLFGGEAGRGAGVPQVHTVHVVLGNHTTSVDASTTRLDRIRPGIARVGG